MKKFIVLNVFILIAPVAFRQSNSDSLAYQLERAKINAMLAQRAQRFGQYDESLTMRTGIFGLQTKNDIRRSNDILMAVVKTDDSIYREIKILLDFRAFQQTQVQSKVKETENNTLGFMNVINKLRGQVDQLKAETDKRQQEEEKIKRMFIISLVLAGIAIVLLLTGIRRSVR